MRDYTFTFQVEENRKSSQPWLETNRAFFFSHKYKSGHRQHWRGGAGSVGGGSAEAAHAGRSEEGSGVPGKEFAVRK